MAASKSLPTKAADRPLFKATEPTFRMAPGAVKSSPRTTMKDAPLPSDPTSDEAAAAEEEDLVRQFFKSNRAKYEFDVDDPDFTFKCLQYEITQAHVNSLSKVTAKCNKLEKEKHTMTRKLDEVLSAQWRMSEDGWTGSPRNPMVGTLSLTVQGTHSLKSEGLHSVTVDAQEDVAATLGINLGTFKPCSVWTEVPEIPSEDNHARANSSLLAAKKNSNTRASRFSTGPEVLEHSDSWAAKYIMDPFDSRRLLWDVAGMLCLTWDVFFVPLGAFEPEETTVFVVMDFFTLVFWLFDIGISCLTGYAEGDKIIVDPAKSIPHYFKKRFVVDLIVVGPDLLFTILKYSLGANFADNVSKLIRAFRVVRIYRLTRIQKLRRIWAELKDQVESELIFILPGMLQHVIVQIILSHFMASVFYMIGRAPLERTWVRQFGYDEASLWDRYFATLHWTMVKFTLGTSNISPQNAPEQAYAIFVNVVGMVFFLWFASSITDSFMELRSLDQGASQEMWLVRRYLRQRKVNHDLSVRILHYADTVCKGDIALVPESKVRMLTMLSDQLSGELKFAVSYQELALHPLFDLAISTMKVMQEMARAALSQKTFAKLEQVSSFRARASSMVMIRSGKLSYFHGSDDVANCHGSAGDWFCEMSLWTSWAHRGDTVAKVDTQSIIIHAKHFGEVIRNDPPLHGLLSAYADFFVTELNSSDLSQLKDVTIAQSNSGQIQVQSRIEQSMYKVDPSQAPALPSQRNRRPSWSTMVAGALDAA